MKPLLNKSKRPVLGITFWLIIGIIGGEMYLAKVHFLPVFIIIILLLIAVSYRVYKGIWTLVFFIICILGISSVLMRPVIHDRQYVISQKKIQLQGRIEKTREGEFNKTLTLNQVCIRRQNTWQTIHSKIQVIVPLKTQVDRLDHIKVIGEVLAPAQRMNPSDKDYTFYLLSEDIVATVKSEQYQIIERHIKNKLSMSFYIINQIEKIFKGNDEGIMQALLMGDTEDLSDEVYEVYSQTGIVHVLSVSGFHIALLMGIALVVLGYLGIPYVPKYILTGFVLWGYGFMTGLSVSTVRTCIMATLVIIARCIWEEEDHLINLALAATIILLLSPFQLYQVGFQLSFTAVLSLLLSDKLIEKIENHVSKKQLKTLKILVPWLSVSLGIAPILAFNFYVVPLLCSLLNLILIPLFSGIIIAGWIILVISLLHLKTAMILAKGVTALLYSVKWLCTMMLHMPLGTLCTGKISLIEILTCYAFLAIIFLYLIGYIQKRRYLVWTIALFMTVTMLKYQMPQSVDMTYLYVGQGDGNVITTTHRRVIVIDGGNFGKGKTLERYIHYKGKQTIDMIILSHSHADHIGGIIDLLSSNLKVKAVFVSKTDQSELMNQLISLCKQKGVLVYQVGKGDCVQIDNLKITYLTPYNHQTWDNANNNSLTCHINYKSFSALFMGDLEKDMEPYALQNLEPVTVLKVGHHGSSSSTSEKMLVQIRPSYAIISCGMHNLYGHPHQSTIDELTKYSATIFRTDKQGAISIQTDGKTLSLDTQIKGD